MHYEWFKALFVCGKFRGIKHINFWKKFKMFITKPIQRKANLDLAAAAQWVKQVPHTKRLTAAATGSIPPCGPLAACHSLSLSPVSFPLFSCPIMKLRH